MTPQLIIAALIATGSFSAAWQIQNWRADAKERDRAEQELVDERNAAASAIRRTEAVITATNAAKVRDAALRRDAAGARTESDRLRASLDSALRTATASHAACIERANTIGELLGTVEAAGRDIAGKADRHASDAKTLSEPWPK